MINRILNFDNDNNGIANYLRNRRNIQLGSVDFGHAFEHYIIQELIAYLGYNGKQEQLSYWRRARCNRNKIY